MKIPSFKKLFKNDFDEKNQSLVEQLAIIINYNFSNVYNALNKNLDLPNNLNILTKEFEVVLDSSGIPTIPVKFTSTFTPARPSGSLVLSANNLTDSTTYPSGGVFVSFSETNGIITVNHITGLQAENNYKLKIVFFP